MWRTTIFLWIGAVFAASMAQAAEGSGPKPFPEFTFKRVGVPQTGTGPRIRVQIEPQSPEAPVAEASPDVDAPVTTAFDWFWAEVSPSVAASAPGRLDVALRQLAKGPAVATPRLDTLRALAVKHNTSILLATIGTKVSPALVLSVMSVESAGRADAVSSAGATGLMQLMPDTAARFGVDDVTDAAQNIKGGVAYLDWLMETFDSDPVLVLAAYNAGEGAVTRYEGVPPFAETRGYVPKVFAAWSVARGLCKTPPELISDGCAFSTDGS